MRVCLALYLSVLLPINVLVKKCVNIQNSHKRRATEARQNIWELGDEFEGDILDGARRNMRKNESYRWPNNTVPYEIDSIYVIFGTTNTESLDIHPNHEKQRQWIIHSLTEITNNSCVKTRLRNKDDKDYVFVTEERSGCSSYTGRIGGRQVLNLKSKEPGQGCFHMSVIVHEFMHVLGFSHQQSVYDRDKYIKINYENVKKGKERDFQLYADDKVTTLGEEYDYKSIMHYSSYAKSKNGKMTIEPKNSSATIERNMKLSEIDIRKLNKVYPCIN